MILLTRYITEEGFIKTLFYKITHNIVDSDQIDIVEKNVISKYNDSLLLLREHSDFNKVEITPTSLRTNEIYFDCKKPGLEILTLPEPCYGSPVECIKSNLSMTSQIECQKVRSYFDNIKINLIEPAQADDYTYISLTEIRSNGLYTKLYKIQFTFDQSWSTTCMSCTTSLMHLKSELAKLNNEVYVDSNGDYDIEGKVIDDLSVNDMILLKGQINILLSNSIRDAKVTDFTIYDMTDRLGEI